MSLIGSNLDSLIGDRSGPNKKRLPLKEEAKYPVSDWHTSDNSIPSIRVFFSSKFESIIPNLVSKRARPRSLNGMIALYLG
jgi:hypothetical protein